MEFYNPTQTQLKNYRHFILQTGGDEEMDRYIYGQMGEGIGSFFGVLLKRVIPFASKAIKGAAQVAKPHFKELGKDLVTEGVKAGAEKLIDTVKTGSKRKKSSNIVTVNPTSKRPTTRTTKRRRTRV